MCLYCVYERAESGGRVVDIWGRVMQKRESPDFRFQEVGHENLNVDSGLAWLIEDVLIYRKKFILTSVRLWPSPTLEDSTLPYFMTRQ